MSSHRLQMLPNMARMPEEDSDSETDTSSWTEKPDDAKNKRKAEKSPRPARYPGLMDDPIGAAIAFRQFAVDNDPVAGGVRALEESLEENGFDLIEEAGEVVVGNAEGLGIFNRLKHLEAKLNKLAAAQATVTEEIAILKRGSDFYLQIRVRYFATVRRDKFGISTPADKIAIAIEAGNIVAHTGDIVFDRTMYEGPDARNDPEVFRLLYGLDPSQASQIGMLPGSINT